MDAVRQLILQKAVKYGSLSALSKQIGKNHAYLQQFIERGVPRNLPENVRELLAPLLDVDEKDLRGVSSTRATPPAEQNAVLAGQVNIQAKIPVYGQAVGGKDGRFILNGNKIADILAPPKLAGVKDAYAVYVVGTSMVPRYYEGEAVYVNPRLPVRQNDFVVVQIHLDEGEPPSAYVKQFVSQDHRRIRLRQFHPNKTIEFATSTVISVHRIVMGGDGDL